MQVLGAHVVVFSKRDGCQPTGVVDLTSARSQYGGVVIRPCVLRNTSALEGQSRGLLDGTVIARLPTAGPQIEGPNHR